MKKNLCLNIEQINENFNYGGEKGRKKLDEHDEEKEYEQICDLARQCVEYMQGKQMSQSEIYDSKIPLSLRKNKLNIQINDQPSIQQINNDIDNIANNNVKQNHQPMMSIRGNKKINFGLKISDLNIVEEKESSNQLKVGQNLKNQQFKNSFKSSFQINSYVNENVYNCYLSFLLNKEYKEDVKPSISDNDDIKNTIGLEFVMNYYKQQEQKKQEEIINDVFRMVKKNRQNQQIVTRSVLFVEFIQQVYDELVEHEIVKRIVRIMNQIDKDLVYILGQELQTQVLTELIDNDELSDNQQIQMSYEICFIDNIQNQDNRVLMEKVVEKQVKRIKECLSMEQKYSSYQEIKQRVKTNLEVDRINLYWSLQNQLINNRNIDKLMKMGNNEQQLVLVVYLVFQIEYMQGVNNNEMDNLKNMIGTLVFQYIKKMIQQKNYQEYSEIMKYVFMVAYQKQFNSAIYEFMQQNCKLDNNQLISEILVEQMINERLVDLDKLILQNSYLMLFGQNQELDVMMSIIYSQYEKEDSQIEQYIGQLKKQYRQNLEQVQSTQKMYCEQLAEKQKKVIEQIDQDIRDRSYEQKEKEESEERNKDYDWHKIWKQLRIYNGPYNIEQFNLQNDHLDGDDGSSKKHYDLKVWKYQFKNKQKPLLKVKIKECEVIQKLNINKQMVYKQDGQKVVEKETIKKDKGLFYNLNKNINNVAKQLIKIIPIKKINKQQIQANEQISCEWINTLTSRKGFIQIQQNMLIFKYESAVQECNHISFIGHNVLQYRKMTKEWPLDYIREVKRRRYLMKKSGINILMLDGNQLVFDFKNTDVSKQVFDILVSLKKTKAININLKKSLSKAKDLMSKNNFTQMWLNYQISNFEYLMVLNELSSRNFKDMTQYPIFPWVLNRYTGQEMDLNNAENYRDLNKCMGILGPQKRMEQIDYKFRNSEQFEDVPPYHHGSHYSNPGIVLYYLLRLDPFNKANKILQGNKYDLADRLFQNVSETYKSATSDSNDVRELIPEFYYMPEMFINMSGYDLGKNQDNTVLGDVQLPQYSHNNAYQFVLQMRQALESQHVSQNLHNWIDLIWGYKQKGKEAVNNYNVFYFLTYEDNVQIKNIIKSDDQSLKQAYETQIAYFGQTPSQLFNEPHLGRKAIEQVRKGRRIGDEDVDLKVFRSNKRNVALQQKEQMYANYAIGQSTILIRNIQNNKVISVKRDGSIYQYQFNSENNNNSSIVPFSCAVDKKKNKHINILSNNNGMDMSIGLSEMALELIGQKILVIGGLWNGLIKLVNIENNQQIYECRDTEYTVSVLQCDREENQLVAGDRAGTVIIYQIHRQQQKVLSVRYKLYSQNAMINCLNINQDMKMLSSCSEDGSIMVYNYVNGEIIRGLQIDQPTKCILSSNPLACLIVYSQKNKQLLSYSINGQKLRQAHYNHQLMVNPILVVGWNSFESLVYGTETGQVIIRELPYLSVLKVCNVYVDGPVYSINFTPDYRYLLVGTQDEEMAIITDVQK